MTEKTDQELAQLIIEARGQARSERFAAAGARAKNPNLARSLRKTIARALTETHARLRRVATP